MLAARRLRLVLAAGGLTAATVLAPAPPAAAATSDTWPDLVAGFTTGGDVTLGADVVAPAGAYLTVPAGVSVSLDLNGHDLAITAAPTNHAAIDVPAGASLVITDSDTDPTPNTLTATGGFNAAGIGGGGSTSGGDITINGGIVNAIGGSSGTGIGSGGITSTGGATITINGGRVTATGGSLAAGIGTSTNTSPDNRVVITGGIVTATGGTNGAGIGGGSSEPGGEITISGGTVTATGAFAAGIGGGDQAPGGEITISGGTVTASATSGGAGIGGGRGGSFTSDGGTITVEGGTVSATGGGTGAGIGGGSRGDGGDIVIREVADATTTVTAAGGDDGAGIGGGSGGPAGGTSGGNITIGGGTVTATGGKRAAGIGGGGFGGGDGGTISIDGGTVTATGGSSLFPGEDAAAGVGGGINGDGGVVHVSGGSLSAVGGAGDVPGLPGPAVGGGGTGAGAGVTVDDGASVTVSGPVAFGRGPTSTGTWGSLANHGSVTVAPSTVLTVPAGVTVTNSGTITNNGGIDGPGTIANTGRIVGSGTVANNGQGDTGTTVATNSFVFSFDRNAVTTTADPPQVVLAGTFAAAGQTMPAPTDLPGAFTGWYTDPDPGEGTQVTDTTALAAAVGDGPLGVTLYAHYAIGQAITFTSTAPSEVEVGDRYTPTATGGVSGQPVVFSIDPGTTGNACSISGGTISFDHAGTCVLAADQAGSGFYTAAPTRTQSIAVSTAPVFVSVSLDTRSSVYGQPVHATADTGVTGTVRFLVDGAMVGAAVPVVAGKATSPSLVEPVSGDPLAPGEHQVVATLDPDDRDLSTASSSVTLTVAPTDTTVDLRVTSHGPRAVVVPVAPGAGTPSGSVTFSVDGTPVGTAALEDGVATLDHPVPTDATHLVSAEYAGDGHFTGSAASSTRANPVITAKVTRPRHRVHGWYPTPVTITFTCAATSAPLTTDCPAPVTLARSGRDRSATRTVAAADGGTATAVVAGIDIDRRAPKVRIHGARRGHLYATVPEVHCTAGDGLSGLTADGCRLTRTTTERSRWTRVRYTATATDRAGNSTTRSVTIRVRRPPARSGG